MRGIILIGATLVLAGCSDSPQARTEAEIRRIAAEVSSGELNRLETRISKLESEIREQSEHINGVRALGLENAENHSNLHKTVNHNVDLANKAAVAAETARGACGQEWVTYPDGGRAWRNKECTLKDLK